MAISASAGRDQSREGRRDGVLHPVEGGMDMVAALILTLCCWAAQKQHESFSTVFTTAITTLKSTGFYRSIATTPLSCRTTWSALNKKSAAIKIQLDLSQWKSWPQRYTS